ncbi:MAG TPA: YlbF family regulator [Alphaproteobacteria bacterium]|nr:YlbF family regulator [Alphaproteobacteria bacterium]
MSTVIEDKARELCQTIVAQPQWTSIRNRIDAFLANDAAKGQFDAVNTKGRSLHEKQHTGQPLNGQEIADFERQRDALLQNPVARGFLEAQDELHEIQHSVQKYISKTLQLGRVPTEADLKEEEDSCGHGNCGCQH